MPRKTLLLDCDGPLSDFAGKTITFVRGQLNKPNWRPADEWAFISNLSTAEQALVEEEWRSPGFVTSLLVVPGAAEAVAQLQELYDVYVVTSPFPGSSTWTAERERWLKRHLDIPGKRVIFAHDKHLIFGHGLIDDKVSNLETWENHRRGHSFLWKMWHNQGTTIKGASYWPEMVSLVNETLQ